MNITIYYIAPEDALNSMTEFPKSIESITQVGYFHY